MIFNFIDRTREDSLTASVLSNLLHLPFEVYWRMLRNACHTGGLPDNPGEPEVIEFWPHWNASRTTNERYVEPDVFLRFRNFDLIIEAKRWDYNQQDFRQWERELGAYATEYNRERKEVRLLALGGIHGQDDAEVTFTWTPDPGDGTLDDDRIEVACPVHMCQWSRILHQCKVMERELQKSPYPTSQDRAHLRILADLIRFFAVHGFQVGTWYEDTLDHRARFSENTLVSHAPFHLIHNQLINTVKTHEPDFIGDFPRSH